MKNVKFQQSSVRICFLAGSLPVNVSCLHNLVKNMCFALNSGTMLLFVVCLILDVKSGSVRLCAVGFNIFVKTALQRCETAGGSEQRS